MIKNRKAVIEAFENVVISAIKYNIESIECLKATETLFDIIGVDIGRKVTEKQALKIKEWYPPIAAELSCIVNAEHRALIEERYIQVIEGALNG